MEVSKRFENIISINNTNFSRHKKMSQTFQGLKIDYKGVPQCTQSHMLWQLPEWAWYAVHDAHDAVSVGALTSQNRTLVQTAIQDCTHTGP